MNAAAYESTEDFARRLDREDSLAHFRQRFHIPLTESGEACIYLCGNSLGLQPKKARDYKETGQICTAANFDPEKCKAQRDAVKLNQPGFRIGGPFTLPKWLFGRAAFDGRNKAFFFVNYEEFHQPSPVTCDRTILTPDAQAGIFKYAGGTVDLLALAASKGQTSTVDPVIGKLLQDIRNSTTGTGAVQQTTNPNTQQFTFTNNSKSVPYYPTLRLDFNLPGNHRLEYVYYYQKYNAYPDLININLWQVCPVRSARRERTF